MTQPNRAPKRKVPTDATLGTETLVSEDSKLPCTLNSEFPEEQHTFLSQYLKLPETVDLSLPLTKRLKTRSLTQDFFKSAEYLQDCRPFLRLPSNFTKFVKTNVSESASSRTYYNLTEMETVTGSKFNVLLKEVLIEDYFYENIDDPDMLRQKMASFSLDLYVTKFLKHRNILSAVFFNSEVQLGRYQIVFIPHTTLSVIVNEHRLRNRQSQRCFENHVTKFIVREVAEALNFLHQRRITREEVGLSSVFISQEGNVRLGGFEHSSMRYMTDEEAYENTEPQFHCKALGVLFMKLVMIKYINDRFTRYGNSPTTDELELIAMLYLQIWTGTLTKFETPLLLNEEETNFVLDTFEEENFMPYFLNENSFLENCDTSEELADIVKNFGIELPDNLQPILSPISNYVLNGEKNFHAKRPVVEFFLDYEESKSYEGFRTSFCIEVEHPHRLMQALTEMIERNLSFDEIPFLNPADIIPITVSMKYLVKKIRKAVCNLSQKEQLKGIFKFSDEIELGNGNKRVIYIVALLRQYNGILFKSDSYMSDFVEHDIFKEPGL